MGEQFRESPPRINTLESPLYIDISRHLRQAVQILFRDEIFLPKMVSLPKLANCCACISLKTGTLIIGFLNLIGSLIFIPVSIALMAGTDAFVDQMRQMLGQSAHYDRQTIATGDGDDDDGVNGDDDDGDGDGDDGGDGDGDGVD